jgi:hypothetical protein
MPNWTTNTLRILVSEERAEALKAALAGPSDWWLEVERREDWDPADFLPASSPDLMMLTHAHPDWRQRLETLGRPAWLPMSPGDLAEIVAHAGDLSKHPFGRSAPVSLPRFRPFRDLADQRAFAADPTEWRRAAIGCKWAPDFQPMTGDDGFWSERKLPAGRLLEAIALTPWTWPEAPLDILRPALDAHGADALWLASLEADVGIAAFLLQGGRSRRWLWEHDLSGSDPEEAEKGALEPFDLEACVAELEREGVRGGLIKALALCPISEKASAGQAGL